MRSLPSLYLDSSIVKKKEVQSKVKSKMSRSVDPDVTARYKLPDMYLHCILRHDSRNEGMKHS